VAATNNVVLAVDIDAQPAWRGQSLDAVVQLSDGHGQPLVNRLLTVEASVGRLQHSFGYGQQEGPVMQLRSGADGRVRLQWQDPTDEPLTIDQRNALELTLATMDAHAVTPEVLRPRFNQLAADYDDERNIYLRRAIDIYSRQGQQYWQRFNVGNAPYEWPLLTGVLRVYLHAGGSTQRVDASAVVLASWKDWVPAWFSFLHDWMSQRAALPAAFGRAKTRGIQGVQLIDKVLGAAHSFVAGQKGFAAELVGQHVVSDAVNRFLSTGIEDLSDEIKMELFPSLEIASEQIRAGNRGTLSLVSETRTILAKDIASVGGIDTNVLSEIRGIQAAIDQRASVVQTQFDSFNQKFTQFNTSYQTFTQNVTTFNTNLTKFNQDKVLVSTQIGKFNTDYTTFQTQRTQLSTDVAVLKTDVAGINTKLSRVTIAPVVINRTPTRSGGDQT
jgi:hypothetical protein